MWGSGGITCLPKLIFLLPARHRQQKEGDPARAKIADIRLSWINLNQKPSLFYLLSQE